MAICNIFKELTNENGTFFSFSQYAEDLVMHQSNNNYKIIPSKFICCDFDYSKFDNKSFPTLLQNNVENGVAFIKSQLGNEWNPEYSKNIFWNQLQTLFIKDNEFSSINYIGDINIQSYSNKDNIGYNEIYCYIPNDAKLVNYKYTNETVSDFKTYPNDYIMGYDGNDVGFNGLLSINTVFDKDINEISIKNYKYYYKPDFNIDFEDNEIVNKSYFDFNTIVVLYDVYIEDNIVYSNIPLGLYVTGIINDGVMSNPVRKYVSNDDIYGAGTSYGLRICNRLLLTQNGTHIKTEINNSTEEDIIFNTMTQAMSAMVETQLKMDSVVNSVYDYHQQIKDHLAQFKQYKTNVPYIRNVNEVYYWFINGKNTNIRVWYDLKPDGDDIITVSQSQNINEYSLYIKHNEFLNDNVILGNENNIIELKEGNNYNINIPKLSINKSGHIYDCSNSQLVIDIPYKGYTYNQDTNSFSIGNKSSATGQNSVAEGYETIASGVTSHAEGNQTTSAGDASHTEGRENIAYGHNSHAEGFGNHAVNEAQHVGGMFATIDDTGNAIFQIGIGEDNDNRKDAFVIFKDGNFKFGDMNGNTVTVSINDLLKLVNNTGTTDLMKKDGSNYEGDLTLVSQSLTPTWTIKNSNGQTISTSSLSSLSIEKGAVIDYTGIWKYNSANTGEKLPTSCSGDWGTTLIGAGKTKTFNSIGITESSTKKSFSQTISAPKSGLIVSNNKVVKATGNDTKTTSNTVTFYHKIYYGTSSNSNLKTLSDFESLSNNELVSQISNLNLTDVDCNENPYIYYIYPSTLGDIKVVIDGFPYGDGEINTYNIINNYGKQISYTVWRTQSQSGVKSNVNISKA